MTERTGILEIYHAGRLTVVGFRGLTVLDHVNVVQCRDELVALVRQHHCEDLAVDLTGVKVLPSGMLGVLGALGDLGVSVSVYNPSDEDREVLRITQLDRVIDAQNLDVP